MGRTSSSRALRRGLRYVWVCAAAVALAGCATGYDLVQPQASGSGSYYTGAGPYGSGYAAGSYYPDAYGYSYLQPYVFTSAFDFGFPGAFGWGYPWAFAGGPGYAWGWGGWGYGYAPSYNYFALPPVWGCGYHHCRRHHRNWRHHDRAHGGHASSFTTGELATRPSLAPADRIGRYPGLRADAFAARRLTPALVTDRPLVHAPIRHLDLAPSAGLRLDGVERAAMRADARYFDAARAPRIGSDMQALRPAPARRDFAPAPAFRAARPAARARPVRMLPMRSFSPPPMRVSTPRATTSRARVR